MLELGKGKQVVVLKAQPQSVPEHLQLCVPALPLGVEAPVLPMTLPELGDRAMPGPEPPSDDNIRDQDRRRLTLREGVIGEAGDALKELEQGLAAEADRRGADELDAGGGVARLAGPSGDHLRPRLLSLSVREQRGRGIIRILGLPGADSVGGRAVACATQVGLGQAPLAFCVPSGSVLARVRGLPVGHGRSGLAASAAVTRGSGSGATVALGVGHLGILGGSASGGASLGVPGDRGRIASGDAARGLRGSPDARLQSRLRIPGAMQGSRNGVLNAMDAGQVAVQCLGHGGGHVATAVHDSQQLVQFRADLTEGLDVHAGARAEARGRRNARHRELSLLNVELAGAQLRLGHAEVAKGSANGVSHGLGSHRGRGRAKGGTRGRGGARGSGRSGQCERRNGLDRLHRDRARNVDARTERARSQCYRVYQSDGGGKQLSHRRPRRLTLRLSLVSASTDGRRHHLGRRDVARQRLGLRLLDRGGRGCASGAALRLTGEGLGHLHVAKLVLLVLVLRGLGLDSRGPPVARRARHASGVAGPRGAARDGRLKASGDPLEGADQPLAETGNCPLELGLLAQRSRNVKGDQALVERRERGEHSAT